MQTLNRNDGRYTTHNVKVDPSDLDYFAWSVPEGGFEVRRVFQVLGFNVERRPSSALVPRSQERRARLYDPLAETELFLKFADLPTSEEAILAFANVYGWLAGDEHFIASATAKSSPPIFGDSLSTWRGEIDAMRETIEVWEALRENNTKALRARINWFKGGVWYVGRRRQFIATPDLRSHLLSRWRRDEVVGPARMFIADQLNRGLQRKVSPRLVMDHSGTLQPRIVPSNLLGAVWYHFYRTFLGEHKIRRCEACGRWMLYIRKTKTMHPECANLTRQKRFRSRHAQETRKQ